MIHLDRKSFNSTYPCAPIIYCLRERVQDGNPAAAHRGRDRVHTDVEHGIETAALAGTVDLDHVEALDSSCKSRAFER
jgi:hypothetical protein